MITWRAIRVWQRNWDVFRRTWRSQIAFSVIEPFMWFLAIGLGLGGFISLGGDARYADYLAPGLLAATAMMTSGAEGAWASFVRMEYEHTFDAIIATPLSVEDVIGGEILWAASRSVESGLALLAVMLLFGVHLSPFSLLVLPVLFLQGVIFAAAGVFVASRVPTIGQLNHFSTLFLSPQFMFAGVFFPLSALPAWVGAIVWFLPLSHGVAVARSVISGQIDWRAGADCLWLLVVGVATTALALRSMRARLVK